MKFSLISIFPEIVQESLRLGVVGQALTKKLIQIDYINPREFTKDVHKTVDDRPFGGGDGMVMLSEPLQQAVLKAQEFEAGLKVADLNAPRCQVVCLSPQGRPLTTSLVRELAKNQHLILVCGRYGGIDQRFLNESVDIEISMGDFILAGGEIAAAALIEAMAREVPGVLGHAESSFKDSFSEGLLEGPSWTRPRTWGEQDVPELLLNGNHKRIEEWRSLVSWIVTLDRRPDLFNLTWSRLSPSDQLSWRIKLDNFLSDDSVKRDLPSFGVLQSCSSLQESFIQLTESARIVGVASSAAGASGMAGTSGATGLVAAAHKIDVAPSSSKGRLRKYPRVSVGLIHHPVYDRQRSVVATNVTNFDIHDIARVCRVYGIENYYIIHPMQEQLMFVERVLDHWRSGYGSKFNPKRKEALGMVKTAETLQGALNDWGAEEPYVIGTSAKAQKDIPLLTFGDLRNQLWDQNKNCFLIFGTGFGLTESVFQNCEGVLESIKGRSEGAELHHDFRHLSVRSAVSIVLDRLLS